MEFTYEASDRKQTLETYEWDNIWLEQAPETGLVRVMIIGDSISCGYRRLVTEAAKGRMYVDGIGTSKVLDNLSFPKLIDYVLTQEPGRAAIQFNNGLHGWHLSTAEYKKCYEKMVDFLLTKTEERRLMLALTTPTRQIGELEAFDKRNRLVLERNEVVREIAADRKLPVNDFYALTADKPGLWAADGKASEGVVLRLKIMRSCRTFGVSLGYGSFIMG